MLEFLKKVFRTKEAKQAQAPASTQSTAANIELTEAQKLRETMEEARKAALQQELGRVDEFISNVEKLIKKASGHGHYSVNLCKLPSGPTPRFPQTYSLIAKEFERRGYKTQLRGPTDLIIRW